MKQFIRTMPRAKKIKSLKIYWDCAIIDRSAIAVRKRKFEKLCLICKNYGKKYSCPPYSGDFNSYFKDYPNLLVFWIGYNPQENAEHSWKPCNKVISFINKRVCRRFNLPSLTCASCSKCLPCRAKLAMPCRGQPEYSMESVGVDCDDLLTKLFGRKLQWIKRDKKPDLLIAMGCVLFKENNDMEESLNKFIAEEKKERKY